MKRILWCYNPVVNHDKVYGCFLAENACPTQTRWQSPHVFITVWGRRGKKMQHKVEEFADKSKFWNKCDEKQSEKKGYEPIAESTLRPIEQEIVTDMEKHFRKLIVTYKLSKI